MDFVDIIRGLCPLMVSLFLWSIRNIQDNKITRHYYAAKDVHIRTEVNNSDCQYKQNSLNNLPVSFSDINNNHDKRKR